MLIGLEPDYALVKPPNRDGYVNWLDTMLQTALAHVGARRVRIRLELVEGHEVCRVDVPASSRPIWTTKGQDRVLFERRNNSTRAVPADELEVFLAERFGLDRVGDGEASGIGPH
jgi:type I restriction enzyme R subunit